MALNQFNSPQPSTSAHCGNSDLSTLINELDDDDDEWLNNVNLEDVNGQSNSTSQLNHSTDDFDNNSGDSWIFPIGYEKREYQLNISRSCLFTNTLVCLPTGLGKTFIASVVIYNYYRWFPRSKIIFMAHSRPLVHQQIDACYKVVGIPPNETAELTGKISRDKRMELWNNKRVFFATPQVIQNDISDPAFPTKAFKLVIVDEAHKAKGRYSYCEVIKGINSVNQKFRVVALSATPGKADDVIEIIKNLLISKIEVRTENSYDVKKYTFEKSIEVVKVNLGELAEVRDRFISIYDPYLRKLIDAKAISANHFNKGFLIRQQRDFDLQSHPQKSEIKKLFSISISLLYSLDLLERHGIQIFLNSFFDDIDSGRLKYFVSQDRSLKDFLDRLNAKYKDTSPLTVNINPLPKREVPSIMDKRLNYGHQKYDVLKQKLTEYFNNGGAKAIIFCEYRETVKMVYTLLLQLRPAVLPKMLMGQSGAVSQKDQLLAMKEFRSNKVNVLVTTSVCEEGIDVGEVDLVICFDISSQNPTRFVQRIGRTGRKRNGKVLILATEGKEEEDAKKVIGSKDKMNKSIHGQKEITKNLFLNAPRLIPHNFRPKCVETKFSIPDLELESKPDTKAKKTAGKKRKIETATSSSTKSITALFPPAKKKLNDISIVDDWIDEGHDAPVAEIVQSSTKSPVHNFPSEKTMEQIKKKFLDDFNSVAHKVETNLFLMTHINWKRDSDLKALAERSQLFRRNDMNMNDSITFDTSWKKLLDDSVNLKESFDSSSRLDVAAATSLDKVNRNIVESQEEQFDEVESRYGNQFSIPEPFNTPYQSTPFRRFNQILNTSSPQPGSSGEKKGRTADKKTPIKDSPLFKAFQKQQSMSSSTPVSSRLVSSFKRTISLQTKTEFSTNESFSTSPSNSTSKQKTTRLEERSRGMTAFEFFGITSIDDIFVSDESEDEPSNSTQQQQPQACSEKNSFAKLLEEDDDIFLDIPMEDEVIESSIVDEIPQKEVKTTKLCENFEINLEDIFVDSEESSDELDKNIENITSDFSQTTQEYIVEIKTPEPEPRLSSRTEETSTVKENIQIVNSCAIEIFSSPPKQNISRPRPNFSKLMNALKVSNFLAPGPSKAAVTSPIKNALQDSSNLRDAQQVSTPTNELPEEKSSSETRKGSYLSVPSKKTPSQRTQNKKIATPKITNFLLNSSSPVVSTFSRTSCRTQINDLNESVVISDNDEREEFSPIVPERKKASRKRKRNNHFFDTQADVDGSDSSDDDGDLTTLDGFLANETVDLTQNDDNHAIYLQSLRSPSARQNGNFKIPQLRPAMSRSMIYSQVPEHDEEDDWEMDSFIVDAVEDVSIESEPDELEIAERRLKEKRKRDNQRKNGVKRRKVIRMEDSSDEDELETMRKQLNSKQ